MLLPAGGKTAPVVVHVSENTHMLLGRGVGGVNVHVNLRHMHMLRHVWVSPCWHLNCRMRTDVDTDVKQEQDNVTCRNSASCCDLFFIQSERCVS